VKRWIDPTVSSSYSCKGYRKLGVEVTEIR